MQKMKHYDKSGGEIRMDIMCVDNMSVSDKMTGQLGSSLRVHKLVCAHLGSTYELTIHRCLLNRRGVKPIALLGHNSLWSFSWRGGTYLVYYLIDQC